jgi:hypothetical protein
MEILWATAGTPGPRPFASLEGDRIPVRMTERETLEDRDR